MARMTLEEIKAATPRVDRAKIEATTEEDIRRHMIEDGENPDAPLGKFVEVRLPVAPSHGDALGRARRRP